MGERRRTLLLTGDVKGSEQSMFASELPLQELGEEVEANTNFLKKLTNVDYSEETIQLQKGTLREGSMIHSQTEEEEPVLISVKSGKGELAQLLLSPLTSYFEEWEGSEKAWSQWFNPFVKNGQRFMVDQNMTITVTPLRVFQAYFRLPLSQLKIL